jgi:6-hydroxycyclohex-1-ene-1-carbonyl-CoA dehydrogenase
MSMPRQPETIKSWQMIRRSRPGEDGAPMSVLEMVRKDIPVPERREGEALVEIAGCGVCGTDIGYFFHGIPTASRPPLILGHEISGTVVAGDGALLGKEVIIPAIIPCRECELCVSGRANRCLRQKMPGNSYGVYGGFASHIPVPAGDLCVVGNRGEFSLPSLAVVADAVSTPYQAARRGDIAPGDRVIIVGVTGGLGIYMAQWAKFLGAETVVGMGRNRAKLDNALWYGADFTINSAGKSPFDIRKEFFSECRRRKIDPKYGWKIFEMSGFRQGQEIALELIGYAGTLVLVGYGTDSIPYRFSKLMAYDADIRGTWGCLPEHYPFILERVLAGDVKIQPFIETRPMSAILATFEELGRGGSPDRRIILTPDF